MLQYFVCVCVLCPLYLSLPKHNAIRVGREPMKEYETDNMIIRMMILSI